MLQPYLTTSSGTSSDGILFSSLPPLRILIARASGAAACTSGYNQPYTPCNIPTRKCNIKRGYVRIHTCLLHICRKRTLMPFSLSRRCQRDRCPSLGCIIEDLLDFPPLRKRSLFSFQEIRKKEGTARVNLLQESSSSLHV